MIIQAAVLAVCFSFWGYQMNIKIRSCIMSLIGSLILAFGLYNIHSFSGVTEGGVLGLTLLLDHWLDISPAASSVVLNILCYLIGCKLLGKKFIIYSSISTIGFSITFKICEHLGPLWPDIYQYPFIAALIGGIFVGVGVGLCVREGGAPSGDDALAMSMSHVFKIKIETAYMVTDLIVLGISLTYIPFSRLWYSLVTVILSGQIVGVIQRKKQ